MQDFEEEPVADYQVTVFLSKEGYFKKITPLSLRMSGEQKLKEGDEILFGKYAGQEVNCDGKTYLIMRQSDVVAIIK